METILVLSAHSDDFVLGAGGTIANYTNEKKNVIAFVFSYGELSHPWLKEDVVIKMRTEETYEAAKILKNKVILNNLKEGHFLENKEIQLSLLKLIQKEKPTKIFTHSAEDPHPDHKAVNKITLEVLKQLNYKPEVYIYSVWNSVSFKTQQPSLYVDITKNFTKKLKSLKKFKSQKIHIAYPVFLLIYRAIKAGIKLRKRFGEQF